MVSDGDTLVEGFHDGEVHDPSQVGLSGEDEDKGVVGIHFEVGQEPELFERAGLKQVCLVDDEDDGFAQLLFGFEQGLLDLAVDSAFGESLRESEESIYMIEEIGPAQGCQRGIVSGEEVVIEAVDVASQGECFSDPWIAGQKEDAPPSLDIVEASQAFIEGFGIEGVEGFDVLVKRESLKAEPC
jgi:hypothetical protein